MMSTTIKKEEEENDGAISNSILFFLTPLSHISLHPLLLLLLHSIPSAVPQYHCCHSNLGIKTKLLPSFSSCARGNLGMRSA